MNKVVPVVCFMLFSVAFALVSCGVNQPTVKESLKEVRADAENWMVEQLVIMDMMSKGYARNEDAGGVYWTDTQ